MEIMNNNAFIEKLKHIAGLPTTYYSVAGGDWAKWNGNSWNFDCVILPKAILWGWCEDKNLPHGGAIYGSNSVYDDTTEQIIERCYNISTDFNNIVKGEILWMDGHVGIYVGNREVIECTAAWEGKVVCSKIDTNGARHRNGVYAGRWKKHGKLPYIEYLNDVEPVENKYKVGDMVSINGVYVSSNSTERLNPAYTLGTITRIVEGTRNPYLLDNGNLGWANDDCIVETKHEEIIKEKPTEELVPTPEPSADILDLVRRTIRGDFGNGEDRKNVLGSNYDEVQRQVNLNCQNGTTNWDSVRLY